MESDPQRDITHINHQVKGILRQAGVLYEGTRIEEGKLVPDNPSDAAIRLVSAGVLSEIYIERLRDSGLEV